MATAVLAAILVLAPAAPEAGGRQTAGGPAGSTLPAGLDVHYPPAADQPVYLFAMLGLGDSLSGIVVDLMEDDIEGARASFEEFRRRYREAAGMVPEWKGEYPEEPVRELGAALAAGDKALSMKAFGAVDGVCHRCHVAAMVPAQQRYHWGDVGAMTVKDPVSGAATPYPQFKKFLAANLAGITLDLRQGQAENARKQFEGFRARFEALRGSCRGCHEGESRYFVDRDVQATVDEIGASLGNRTVAANAVTALTQRIGRESCSKCHLVHVPAALAGASRQ
jgi:hypothetical protein